MKNFLNQVKNLREKPISSIYVFALRDRISFLWFFAFLTFMFFIIFTIFMTCTIAFLMYAVFMIF